MRRCENSPSVTVPESFALRERFHLRRALHPGHARGRDSFQSGLTMRYGDLRDWRGGLLLRCPLDGNGLSRIVCGPIFDCARQPSTAPAESGALPAAGRPVKSPGARAAPWFAARMRMRRSVIIPAAACGILALTACVGDGPSPETIAREFAEPIEPVWEVEVPGLYGELVVHDGIVLTYADDDEVGMLLRAHSLDDGELLWEHTSSPGGAFANPMMSSVDAASRPYPLPTISPLVVETGDEQDLRSAVVFFERDTHTASIRPDDLLRVADLRTGELLEVTVPDVDPDEFSFEPLGQRDDGEIFANVRTPASACGARAVCWVTEDRDAFGGSGVIRLDAATLEARFEGGHIPATDESLGVEWGLEYARISADGTTVARFHDGAELWRVPVEELFGVARTSPPDQVEFLEVGGLVLIQGYQPILETIDRTLPHTLSIDFAESRTLVALDRESGEVAWRLPGADMLCHAVRERAIPAEAETIPLCHATGGGYSYDIEADTMLDEEPIIASIAELTIADGELGWEVEGAGDLSLAHVGRLLRVTYAARGDLAVVEREGATGLVDLRDGAWHPVPTEDAAFVCKAERADQDLDFEGSVFAGGSNPVTTGYPGGWYLFACDDSGEQIERWTTGAVRVAGHPDADGTRVVLPLEASLVAFDI